MASGAAPLNELASLLVEKGYLLTALELWMESIEVTMQAFRFPLFLTESCSTGQRAPSCAQGLLCRLSPREGGAAAGGSRTGH
jgi:hypothetical protein